MRWLRERVGGDQTPDAGRETEAIFVIHRRVDDGSVVDKLQSTVQMLIVRDTLGNTFSRPLLLLLSLGLLNQSQQRVRLLQRPAAIAFFSVHIEYLPRDREVDLGRFEMFTLLPRAVVFVPRDLRHLEDVKT